MIITSLLTILTTCDTEKIEELETGIGIQQTLKGFSLNQFLHSLIQRQKDYLVVVEEEEVQKEWKEDQKEQEHMEEEQDQEE
jgi:predicted SpoU family rRNA methylase